MITKDGPKVIEFNARFGDPEAQIILPRLENDLLEVLWATARGRLHEVELRWHPEPSVAVVLASGGYPGPYETGFPIRGLDTLDPDVLCFHAGTKEVEGEVLTDGGRVLALAALGGSVAAAREKVYRNIPRIRFPNAAYRQDIAAGL
jgi:phosphoribosylamine--glycine ligase